jgi:hypothetical protein
MSERGDTGIGIGNTVEHTDAVPVAWRTSASIPALPPPCSQRGALRRSISSAVETMARA